MQQEADNRKVPDLTQDAQPTPRKWSRPLQLVVLEIIHLGDSDKLVYFGGLNQSGGNI